MKLNLKIKQIVEDLNFEIDNDNNITLHKSDIIDKVENTYNLIVLKRYCEILSKNYKNFKECLELYNKTTIKLDVDYILKNVITNNMYCTYNKFSVLLEELMKKMIGHSPKKQIKKYDKVDLNWLDTSNVKDMTDLFKDYVYLNVDITEWDTSNVENMANIFDCVIFAEPVDLSKWNVGNVKLFPWAFGNIKSEKSNFIGDITNWDTHSAISMCAMFYNSTFNLPIGNWDVSNVNDFSCMFRSTMFNLDLSNWNINTNKRNDDTIYSFTEMFGGNYVFNQDLSNWEINGDNSWTLNMFRGNLMMTKDKLPNFTGDFRDVGLPK